MTETAPIPTDPNELVYIQHDDIATLGGPVSRQALELNYAGKGWREATADEIDVHVGNAVAKAQEIEDVEPEQLDELTADIVDGTRKRDELDEIARGRGIDASLFDNMPALRDAIKATL